jgi:hypothetical protein
LKPQKEAAEGTHHAYLGELERKIEKHDGEIRAIFEAIQQLIEPPVEEKPKRRIGFHHD